MKQLKDVINWRSPTEVLFTAACDMKALSENPDYQINMDNFHRPVHTDFPLNDYCAICLAGAVMANTLGTNKHDFVGLGSFDEDQQAAFNALDDFRCGRPVTFVKRILKDNSADSRIDGLAFMPFIGKLDDHAIITLRCQALKYCAKYSVTWPLSQEYVKALPKELLDVAHDWGIQVAEPKGS